MSEQMIVTDAMIEAGYRAFVARKPIASTDAEREACKAIYAAMAAHSVMAGKVAELTEALENIANPLAAMKRRAEAEGNRLSGMAYQISNDADYLKGIARAALAHPKGME